jgi:FAD:protein FMN transferase
MQRLEFFAMGCQMLTILDWESPLAAERIQQVPQWFGEWEQCLSRFRTDSELSAVNRSAGRWAQVSEVMWDVFHAAMQAAQETHGLVTPTILEDLERAGYDRSFEKLHDGAAHTQTIGVSNRAADWRAIDWNAHTHSIFVPEGVRLDFGGIAKGWAADQAVQRLSIYGPALVDAGGDIAVSHSLDNGQAWPIELDVLNQHTGGDVLPLLMVSKGGVATSGRDYRHWQCDGKNQHHIIDPRTGCPADTDVLTATVIAPSTREAEVAAKVALILGSRNGLEWIDARPTLAGILVLEDGRRLYSRRAQQYLWS